MPPIQNSVKPSPSTTTAVLDSIREGTGYVVNYVKNLDSQTVIAIAGIAATLGIGSAALYLGSRKKSVKSKSRVNFADSSSKSTNEAGAGDIKTGLREGSQICLKCKEASQRNVLVLKQCPRGRKTPAVAPFPLKLETFLRVHGIEYELDFNGHEPKEYGSPWITFNTEDIADSQNVIAFLVDQYDVQTEKGISSSAQATALAYTHLLENHLYWGIALWRWVYDGARSLKDIQLLPKKTQQLVPDVCRTVEQAAWFHGIGKMSPEEVKKAVIDDLKSLSEFLGDKEYFLNTKEPTELDCTAFGMLSQFLWNMQGPFHDAITDKFKNLRDFCWRIRQKYWPDWEDCLNNTEFFTNDPYPVADSINYPF